MSKKLLTFVVIVAVLNVSWIAQYNIKVVLGFLAGFSSAFSIFFAFSHHLHQERRKRFHDLRDNLPAAITYLENEGYL